MAERARGVRVGKTHAVASEGIDIRRGDFGIRIVAAGIAIAHVVDQDDQDVGIRRGDG
jgi:hypothetical protein